MRDNAVHPSDQELLLYADGEISQSRLRQHLAECQKCKDRAAELENALGRFVELHRSSVQARSSRADGLRSSLRAQFAVARQASHHRFTFAFWQQVICAGALLAIVAAGMWRMHTGFLRQGHADPMARALPDRSLTPGYARPVKLSELCRMKQPNAPGNEDISLTQRVFRAYGLPVSTSASYELDYLIAPDLGGADDVRNLWPEPYGSTEWNAHVKDALENRLHSMVCDGQIDLATAQKEIATDWIAAYKRYFHTETPLPNRENGTLSRPGPDAATTKRLPDILLSAGRFGFVPIL
jgi:hypothetical protein